MLFFVLSGLGGGCNAPNPRPGGWLYYNIHGAVTSLDPAFASHLNNMLVVRALFSTLVEVDADLRIRPGVAKRWEVFDSGRTYVFHLRNDVWFHDDSCFPGGRGRRLTARDAAFSLLRLVDSATASPGAWLFRDRFLRTPDGDYSPAVTAPDDTTLIIRLRRPFPPMLGLLALPYCGIVPPEAVARYGRRGFGRHPVGSGPFRMHYWREGHALSLVRHPRYFRPGRPRLEGVFISFIENPESEFLAFVSGRIDVLSGAQKAMVDFFIGWDGRLKPALARRYRMIRAPFLNTEYLGLLQDSGRLAPGHPLQSADFRKALAFAVDRRKMMRFLRRGVGAPGEGSMVPPAMLDTPAPGYAYHPDSARYYLQRARQNGVGVSRPLTIHTTAAYLDLCLFVAENWRRLGVPARVEVHPSTVYRHRMRNGEFAVFRASWIADYPDPESYLSLFYSAHIPPNGPNYTRFQDSAYDAAYARALAEPRPDRRRTHYRRMMQLLHRKAPVVVLYYDEVLHIAHPQVTGLRPHPMGWIAWETVGKTASVPPSPSN